MTRSGGPTPSHTADEIRRPALAFALIGRSVGGDVEDGALAPSGW